MYDLRHQKMSGQKLLRRGATEKPVVRNPLLEDNPFKSTIDGAQQDGYHQ
jgi:hypothetical protein